MKLDTGKKKHYGKNKNRPPWYGICNNLRPLIVSDVIVSGQDFLKDFDPK